MLKKFHLSDNQNTKKDFLTHTFYLNFKTKVNYQKSTLIINKIIDKSSFPSFFLRGG